MSDRENKEDIESFTKLTIGINPLNGSRRSDPKTKGAPRKINIETLPTIQPLEGCPISTVEMFPELAENNQPRVEDLVQKITPKDVQLIQSITREREEQLPELVIENVMISLWNADEIRRTSIGEINSDEDQGMNTINDPRMGVVSYGTACPTCHKDYMECPGHYGHIELAEKIFNPILISTIIRILSSVCNSCGGLLLTQEQIMDLGLDKYTGSIRFKFFKEESVKLPCLHGRSKTEEIVNPDGHDVDIEIGEVKKCLKNPEYLSKKSKEIGKILFRYEKKGKEFERTVDEVVKIFDAISSEDAELLGFHNGSHPSSMILKVLLVIPPCIRIPNVRDGIIMPDSIATLYKDIIKANNNLKLAKDEKNRSDYRTTLVFNVSHLIDNTDGKYTHGKSDFKVKSIKERIQGKGEIIRGHSMGKRVNFSGRTVIGPDPSLKFHQIRLPSYMKKFLTRPVIVTNFNQDALMEMLEKGEITHITFGPARRKNLKGRRVVADNFKDILLPGDKVDRWAQDGDYVIANRQPTLHSQGMMGHEIVFSQELTIGLPLSVTTPYNADFDGDEMNIHMVQTDEAYAEVVEIMNVKNCIMNAQKNSNIMGLVMDNLTGVYLMTQEKTMIDTDTWEDCLMIITASDGLPTLDERLKKHNVSKFSGRALFSALLPEDIYYHKGDVTIIDGILTNGVINKDHVGVSYGSLIQELWKRYGRERTADFLTDAPWVINRWLRDRGFSVGLKDCYPLEEKHKKIIEEEFTKSKLLAQSQGIKLTDPLEEERREKEVIGFLNRGKDLGANITKNALPFDNSLRIMAQSGAKGSAFNIAQITAGLGQQFTSGKRMPLAITGGKRSLPVFEEGDLDPESRGFVTKSFVEGLSPAELFFHQAGGREGLIDTAVKTSETGALHHRMIKALEDLKVDMNGSVINSIGQIIQPVYGEDGFSGGEVQFVEIEGVKTTFFINLDQVSRQINSKYGYN